MDQVMAEEDTARRRADKPAEERLEDTDLEDILVEEKYCADWDNSCKNSFIGRHQ
jgi:hypothetical protein